MSALSKTVATAAYRQSVARSSRFSGSMATSISRQCLGRSRLTGVVNPRLFSFSARHLDVDSKTKPTSESESAKMDESKQKDEGEQDQDKDKDKDKDKEDKEKEKEKAPPPPHGDKSPWQVFTETLRAEFEQSKEWKEGTQALSSGIDEFAQKESIRKARDVYQQTSDVASTKTSEAFRTTGRAIEKGAVWTWDTTVVRGVRKSVNAAGRGIEKATRPVRETETFKSVRDVIDDGSSSRYGGWVEKEERRRLRERRLKSEGQSAPAVEDPNAGTNVTLHKDAKWKESWRDFRDQSPIVQSIFSLKSSYQESENPLVVTARSITDRLSSLFSEGEGVAVIRKFREMDPTFRVDPFLQEMREYVLPEVLDAYVKGDLEVLKQWLSAAQFSVYSALMKQYVTKGLKSDGRILDIRNVDIVSSRLLDPGEIPVFVISCRTQEVHVFRNAKTGALVAGMDDNVQQVTYAIGLTRIPEDVSNPETRGWRLIELHKSARNYL